MRSRWLMLAAICCAELPAQIDHLATTSDGSVLYLSGRVNLIGKPAQPGGAVFRWTEATGFEELTELDAKGIVRTATTVTGSYDGVALVNVTAEGSLISLLQDIRCNASPGSRCYYIYALGPLAQIVDLKSSPQNPLWSDRLAAAVLSANGKFALMTIPPFSDYAYLGPIFRGESRVRILADGTAVNLPGNAVPAGAQAVSDEGAVVMTNFTNTAQTLASPTASIPLKFSHSPSEVRIARDGAHILYVATQFKSQSDLYYYDLGSEQERHIATPLLNYPSPYLDDTGTQAIFLNATSAEAPPQLFLWSALDPDQPRQISQAPEGVTQAILSGSGQVAYAVTNSNRILRIDVTSGDARELSGFVPVVPLWNCLVPGSLVIAEGSGLVGTAGRSQLTVDGQNIPIVNPTSTSLSFQYPWDAVASGSVHVSLFAVDNPVFEHSSPTQACAKSPQFLSTAIHEDFRGPVTQNDPARPAEILHFYMTGLGPVSPPLETGQPASANPVHIATTPDCDWIAFYENSSLPNTFLIPTVTFAGLAPGTVGVYQYDAALPKILPSPPANGPTLGTVSVRCVNAAIFYFATDQVRTNDTAERNGAHAVPSANEPHAANPRRSARASQLLSGYNARASGSLANTVAGR